jgi:oxalate---CoA ligase
MAEKHPEISGMPIKSIQRTRENEHLEMISFSSERIIEFFQQRAISDSAAPAIIAEDRPTLSYGELFDQIEGAIRVLIATGVAPEDRVAIVGSSGAEMVVLFLAVASIAACAPLNPSYTALEFDFYLRDLTPRLLIVEAELPCPVRDVARQLDIPVLEYLTGGRSGITVSFTGAPCDAACAEFATADHTALVLHTSGTTARPKMVPLTQRNLCNSAFNIVRSLDLSPTDRCLSVMPLFHIHGLIGAALSTFASAGCLVCTGIFRPSKFFGWLNTFQPTWYTAVPSMHSAVLAQADARGDIPSSHRLRFIRSCSASLPPRTAMGLEDLFGVPVVEAYGMTEAAHQMACNPLPPGLRKVGSVGIPTGTEIAIVDETGTRLPQGVEGEIVVRGPNVMAGYVASERTNANDLIDGWFRTGDQGQLDRDGYLFITGRIKEVINRGGEKISPREIDEVLLNHPAVAEAVTFAIPDARMGEEIGVAIVLRPKSEGVDARTLLNFAQTRLAAFKLPRQVSFVSEIPKGPTGKLQRIGLAKRLLSEERVVSVEAADSPCSPTELTLLCLCREVFQSDTISIHENLFESGGDADSLSAEMLLLEIERHWNVPLTVADLLAGPTIAEVAKVIDTAEPARQAPQLGVIQAGGACLPFFCVGAGPRFRELARLLGSEQPFLATVHPRQPGSIEDIATHHFHIIRNAQPHGPYFLGGYCIGGLVAYEVAQRLLALGEPVGLLVLFDTSFCSSRRDAIGNAVERGIEHLRWIRGLSWREIFRKLLRRFGWGDERVLGRIDHAHRAEFRQGGGWMEERIRYHAFRAYRPRPYDGRVLLLQASLGQPGRTQARQDWRRYVRGVFEAWEVPGHHTDMLEKPNVALTAEKLSACLRSAGLSLEPHNTNL